MKYKIKDGQNVGEYFGTGNIINTKKEVLEQLLSYHDTDFSETLEQGDGRTIYEYVDENYESFEDKLNFILDWGEWELIEISGITDSSFTKDIKQVWQRTTNMQKQVFKRAMLVVFNEEYTDMLICKMNEPVYE